LRAGFLEDKEALDLAKDIEALLDLWRNLERLKSWYWVDTARKRCGLRVQLRDNE